MGFGENGCRRACLAGKNKSLDDATNWVMEHMGDPDFNDPLPAAGGAGADAAMDEAAAMLESMGFASHHCRAALKRSGNSVEAATEFLFSKSPDELDLMAAEDLSEPPATPAAGTTE